MLDLYIKIKLVITAVMLAALVLSLLWCVICYYIDRRK